MGDNRWQRQGQMQRCRALPNLTLVDNGIILPHLLFGSFIENLVRL
jgi:hypothetical protein